MKRLLNELAKTFIGYVTTTMSLSIPLLVYGLFLTYDGIHTLETFLLVMMMLLLWPACLVIAWHWTLAQFDEFKRLR